MESVATSDGLDVAQEALWDSIVESSVLLKYDQPSRNTPSSEHDERLWMDILKNNSLRDYDDAFEDTQEGENTTIVEHCADGNYDEEDYQVDGDNDNRAAGVSQMEDGDSLSDNDAESVTDFDEHDGHEFDTDDGLISHVSELRPVIENEESGGNGYDGLFDPSDEIEADYEGMSDEVDDPPGPGGGVLTFPQQLLAGMVHQRDEEIRRAQDRKRTKVGAMRATAARRPALREVPNARKLERYEDFAVYSSFKSLHVDRCGIGGLRASNIKIPRNYREAMRSK
ncbi:hypothetical protein GN958_ATG02112 [Phytophthora infestans]|uniref:Uncharacterized protein n=1 Tax=Phytophthora infestans TaxID=4787 RepID=A0A8S9V5B3_PHYIN|nr:hypothetical protein GN958_ATG02112 [Phytophthora infestans]